MIYFTSDFHLSHNNIRTYCNRPFDSVKEMDNTILSNLHTTLKKGDILYFLGDLSMGQVGVQRFLEDVKTIGVEVHIILGNHDRDLQNFLSRNRNFYPVRSISDIKNIILEGQSVTLCHYPMLTFNKSHYGAWQLYGHHHNGNFHANIPPAVAGKRMNVGVDVNNFMPVSWEKVKEYMSHQPNNFDLIPEKDWR